MIIMMNFNMSPSYFQKNLISLFEDYLMTKLTWQKYWQFLWKCSKKTNVESEALLILKLKTWDFFSFVSWCPFVKQKFSWTFNCRRQIKHLKTSDGLFVSLSSILFQFLSFTKRNRCSLHRRRALPGSNVLVNEDRWPCTWHWETWKGPQIYPSPIQKNHTRHTVTLTAISVISIFIYLSSAIHLLQISIQSLHILPSLPRCTLLILPTHIS
jgi:hypothetical protein